MRTAGFRFELTAVAVFALLFAAACERTAAPAGGDELSGLDFSSIVEPVARWQAYGLKDYSIEQKRICFCRPPHGFVRLTIKDNKIAAGLDLTTNEFLPREALQNYQTINELFAWIKENQAGNPARLEVQYHAQYGYPEKIAFDYSTGLADDELWIETQELKK